MIPVVQMVAWEMTYCRAYTAFVNLPGWSKLCVWWFIAISDEQTHYGEDNVPSGDFILLGLLVVSGPIHFSPNTEPVGSFNVFKHLLSSLAAKSILHNSQRAG